MPPELWTDPVFWALAIVGVFLTGVSKSGFAGGAGVVAVPLLALVAPPALAIIVMLPLLLLMDAQIIAQQRRNLSLSELKIVIPAALIGVGLGTFVLNGLADAPLQLLLGILSLAFAVVHWLKPSMQSHTGLGWVMGSIAGVTSTLIHAGGPPLNMYLATRHLSRAVWISTAAMFFASINFAKVFAYAAIDLWQMDLLIISLYLIPASVLGIVAGHKIQAVISEQGFVRAVMLCLAVSGLLLILKAVMA
ncbi:MAG: sulfite exporter TauE/SafE family protein [Nevskiales bacterium]